MRPKPSKPQAVEKLLSRSGFIFVRSRGSHRFYRHADRRMVTVAFHPGDIPTGTLRAIIAQVGLTVERFNELI
jgi:predicted RNA binding protein YcfA (HicA-like mRNA interferase family)